MKRKISHFPIGVFLMCGLLISGGCKKEEPVPVPSAPKPAPVVKVQPPVQAQQSSVKRPEGITAELSFSNKKDPFKSFLVTQPQAAKPALTAVKGGLLPIQSYETNKFRVAGIIVGLKESTALVVDPTGRGYVVKQGMLIGNNNGRISKISATAIYITENFLGEHGHMQKKTIKLVLPPKK